MTSIFNRSTSGLRALSRSVDFGSVTKWIFFSALIGCFAGLAGVGFEQLIHLIKEQVFERSFGDTAEGVGEIGSRWWLVLLLPTAGGLVTGLLVQTFAPEAEGHGTDSVIRSFHFLKGVVRKRIILLKALASAITIGTGGSAGQEGPVAQVGAGIGSTLADAFKLSERDRRMFLLSGARAGIGAMFCSPMGGALFMPEVLYRKPEFEGDSIIPCIIASIFAYATFTAISGVHQAIPLDSATLASLSFETSQILVYLVLAIACTAAGWLYVKTFYGLQRLFGRLTAIPKAVRPALGGLLLGGIALTIGPFAGEQGIFFGGYGLIRSSVDAVLPVQILLALVVAKILATSFSISSGGSGGVFAPSLAIGALVGAAIGQGADLLFPGLGINPANFALVGMGGFFAGVAKVPVASVLLVSEMTGNYELLAPLMLVSVVHVMLSNRWSLYEAQVDGMVDSPTHAGDFVVDVLADIRVRDIIDDVRKPHLIHQDTTLRRVLKIVSDAKESYFPVVDEDERMVGIFSLTDLRRIYLEEVVEDFVIVRDFMIDSVIHAELDENLDEVLRRLTRNNINAIPIMDPQREGHVVAVLERNEIGRAYDRRLREFQDGEHAASSWRKQGA
jgi:CIC family chloride channel protein